MNKLYLFVRSGAPLVIVSVPAILLWFWPEGAIESYPILGSTLQVVGGIVPSIVKISSASDYSEASNVGFAASWLLVPVVVFHMFLTSSLFGMEWNRDQAYSKLWRMGMLKKVLALFFLIFVVVSIYRFEPSIASSSRIGRFLFHAYTENRVLSGLIASVIVVVCPLLLIAVGTYLKVVIAQITNKKGY